MNRKVTYLRVHNLSALFDGIGNVDGNSLPLAKRPELPITMTEGPYGIEVYVAVGKGLNKFQIIPYANIQKYDVEHTAAPSAPTTGPKVAKAVPTVASPAK